MAEIVAESLICNACGADIRDESQFCYNCGETITDLTDRRLQHSAPELVRPTENGSELQAVKTEPEKLRSAASLRKRQKIFNLSPAEYSWEKRTGPSPVFVIAAILLTIFAGVLLFLALYLR